jgi:DNA-binding response OmpR family regulator
VPPDELPFLFDRFFQAKNQEHAKAGGTGIGLSLTHEVVKALGGEISVESTLGVGSTFLVKLPMTNKSAFLESGANGSLEGRKPVTATLLLPTEKQPADPNLPLILLIEDNPDVVEYLAACLSSPSRAGSQGAYQLDFAYNGRAGIEKALETIPDLIVSDVMMPEKDGFEVVETLKHNELTSHIPIVLLTAKADVQSRIAGLKRGADAYLSKPFHQEELLATLANLLEQRKRLQAKYSDGRLMVSDSLPQSPITNHQSPVSDPEDALLQKVQTAVLDNLSDSNFKVEDLCRAVATGQSQLNRKLMALTGMSTIAFIRSTRLAKAKELLLAKEMNISEVAYAVGFDDPKYFSRAFMEQFGIAPSKLWASNI